MIAAGLLKPLDEGTRKLCNGNRRQKPPANTLKVPAVGKLLSEVTAPSGKGWPREPEERLQTTYGVAAGATLAQRGDDPKHRRPVNPPAPEEHRWRQHPAPAAGLPAAKTEAHRVSLRQIRGAAARLTLVARVMQGPPAKGHGLA